MRVGDVYAARCFAFVAQVMAVACGALARRGGADPVASEAVLGRMDLPAGAAARRCGELVLRGKGERVSAYSMTTVG